MKRVCTFFAILSLTLLPVGAASAATQTSHGDNLGKATGHTKDNPGKAKGHAKTNPGKAAAPGQLKKSSPAGVGASSKANSKSQNENKKITFCHVPPGNPANGQRITTSVYAIQPGHTNHPGDIIPPFSFVKQGKTVSFSGQNWDADGRATFANGCFPAVASGGASVDQDGQVGGVMLDDGSGLVDGMLPEAGGQRVAVLVAGLGLVAAGAAVLFRNRRFFG